MKLRGLRAIVSMAIRADPGRAFALTGVTVFEGVIRAGFALWLKLLIDGTIQGEARHVIVGAAAWGASIALLGVLNMARVNMAVVLHERTAFLLDQELIQLATAVPGLEHHERAEYRTELELLRKERIALGGTVNALTSNLLVGSYLVGTVGLLTAVHPALLALPLFSLPSMVAGHRAAAIEKQVAEEGAENLRTAAHLFKLSTSPEAGKELRIFGLRDEFRRRHGDLLEQYDAAQLRAGRKVALLESAGWTVFALAHIGALALVVNEAVRHPATTSPGDVAMAFRITDQVNQMVAQAGVVVRWLARNLVAVRRLLWLRDFEAEHRLRLGGAHPPVRLQAGIEFEAVHFAYPAMETRVLHDVNLTIPAGSTVALVGENGAGKTTLVKLLFGFYAPTHGQITVDGVDLADIDVEKWRSATSAGFQDFARFEFLLRESVGVGDVPSIDDPDAIREALGRAHGLDVVDAVAKGLDSQLGRTFDEGIDLSLGQWQKVALGRAMMREDPLLLVLDEPTASLDADTEHALFERYQAAARAASASRAAITVLVSHRFSTVRMADLIVVLEDGRITEMGSHADLVKNGGLYAELYELQARAYR